jgi:hypothetical protein
VGVVDPATPLVLFTPRTDAARLAFTRIGDAGRRGLFRLGMSPATGQPVFHLELPVDPGGWSPPDYTASLVIKDRIAARHETIAGANALHLRVRGLGPRQVLHVTLMEDDGTSWSAAVPVDSTWTEQSVPLSRFTIGKGVLLPQGFPGEWNYWVGPAAGRGGSGDRPRLGRVERLQLSLRREEGVKATAGRYGVEVESVVLDFGRPRPLGPRSAPPAGEPQHHQPERQQDETPPEVDVDPERADVDGAVGEDPVDRQHHAEEREHQSDRKPEVEVHRGVTRTGC